VSTWTRTSQDRQPGLSAAAGAALAWACMMRPALSRRIGRQGRHLQPVPAGRVWQVQPVKGVSYGITDISSFLMAHAKSLSFALGFPLSLVTG